MLKKTLTRSIKILKISTWISAILAILIVLVVGFFVAFPVFLKAPIQQQLSALSGLDIQLSKITFNFKQGNMSLRVHDIDIAATQNQQPLISVKNLQWQIAWLNLFDDIYHPNKIEIEIDKLSIYSDSNSFSVADIKAFARPEVLEVLMLFKSVSVDKTVFVGDYNFELMPLVLTVDTQQLQLDIAQQMLGNKIFDISATFALAQLGHKDMFTLPISLQGDDFNLVSTLKLYSEQAQDFLEFKGVSKQMELLNVAQYLPVELVGKELDDWLNQAFKSGQLDNININIKQNMSEQTPPSVSFSAHVSNAELLFDEQWQSLKNLDADVSVNDTHLIVQVNSTVLNKMPLQNIRVEMLDMSKDILDLQVNGKVSTQSEALIEFLTTTPLSSVTTPILEQFTLSGQAVGYMNLIIPLDKRQPIIDVDLKLTDSRLTVLEGVIAVENLNSTVGFHNNQITTNGVGNIRGTPFNIRINPSDKTTEKQALFAVELLNQQNQLSVYISQQTAQLWHARVDSEALTTDINIVLSDDSVPNITLAGLRVAKLEQIKGDWQLVPDDFPNMHLKSNGVYIDDYQLPDFTVELVSEQHILNINNLEFDGVGVNQNNLVFNGNWLDGITTLLAQAKGDKLSDFLGKMNVEEQVKGGKFDFDLRLFCQCAPWNMNFQDLSGHASMNVKEGVFTNQDHNIGRLLSLLNIQSIARRLKLKINDLTDKGFAYDDIQSSVYFGDSLAKIENFQLNATSSTIRLTGNSNIVNQQYNLLATVRPAISDSVPIAAYLAGGGLTGLGVWMADKLLFDGKVMDSVVDSVAEFEYKITGSWNDPDID